MAPDAKAIAEAGASILIRVIPDLPAPLTIILF